MPTARRRCKRMALAVLACAGLTALAAHALDARYSDKDGDLVADAPEHTTDPATLVFAYSPGEDLALYERIWGDFLRHLERATGKRVLFYAVQSNTAQVEAMRAGRLHIAAFGTGTVPIAVNCAGFVPFAIMGGDKGILGYQMEIITYPGSGIQTPADLKGRKLAFTSVTSNSGYKMAAMMLERQFNLKAGKDYVAVFSGKHEHSVLGVANRDYEAAAIANEVMRRMMARGVVSKDQIVSVYKSQTFPTAGFGLIYNLNPVLAKKVREAFFSFPWAGSQLEKEFSNLGVSKFVPITYAKDWAVVRDVDAAMNVSYNCK
ncbi:MAG TPA: phosphate/phosphite/phosphonate ABC transporter substrate-binding protein [Burkholderiales bacterium]|nr:phosphate/phosphite/phosphonate ABC transporter substrate-binding protein [Burkholderiales bacterium]